MKKFLNKYLKWLLLALLIFVFAIIVRLLLNEELTNFDKLIYSFIISFKTPLLTSFFKFVSFLSSPIFLIILSILLFYIFKNKKYAVLSLCNLIFIVISNQILKLIFSRPRPLEWMLIEEKGFSFPSGHAMTSAAFYGILIYLIWKTNIQKKYKKILTIVLGTLIFLIGLSRIYLGVHYTSDILAGFTLSISYIIIITTLIDYYLKNRKK